MKKFQTVISVLIVFIANISIATAIDDKTKWLPFYNSATFTPHWLTPNSEQVKTFHQVSDFSFVNQNGNLVTNETVKNKIYVASFFFTSCPGICPKMRSQLAKVQETFIDNSNILIISHSIQPSNDTVEVLKSYAQKNGVVSGKWHLVTGKREHIYDIAKKDYFASEDLGKFVDEQDFLHTENLILVDKNMHIRGIYNGLNNRSVIHLIEDIKRLEKETLL
jgi:protein SCO1/2